MFRPEVVVTEGIPTAGEVHEFFYTGNEYDARRRRGGVVHDVPTVFTCLPSTELLRLTDGSPLFASYPFAPV